ncbi:MAG TPA: HAD hydrolase-like protein [Mycobacteriales bacterium]|nr:HAD hydrolase-like protein [Mycobacteriales bacterium]
MTHNLPTAILLDFDDTLIATSHSRRGLFFDHLRLFGASEASIERLAERWGLPFPEMVRAALAADTRENFVLSYIELMRRHPPAPCPGAGELLRTARRADVPVAVVSSSSRQLIEVDLVTLGLDSLVNRIYGVEDVPFVKPDPRVLDPARRYLGEEFGIRAFTEALFVGDSLIDHAAVGGACRFAAVLSGSCTAEEFLAAGVASEYIFHSLEDVVSLLSAT